MWAFGGPALNLTPHPDFLVIADDTESSQHSIEVETLHGKGGNVFREKTREVEGHVHVLNPGSFAAEKSFLVFSPTNDEVSLLNV